jgi:NitT/TauT family transport system substrate-binding protein
VTTRTHEKSLLAAVGFAAAMVLAIAGPSARANDVVRFGKGHPTAFAFIPVDVGVAAGIFARHGIDLQVSSFLGAGKFHQAFAAGAIDMGAASGPDMVFVAKGSPCKAVANMLGPPKEIAVGVPYNSPIKTLAELKGKKMGVTTTGSLTWWLPRHLSEIEGWGPDGIETVSLNSTPGEIAALRTNEVDAITDGIDSIFVLENKKEGRLLLNYGDYIKNYMMHVIYASNDFMAQHPDDVRKVLAAWFDTIEYMKTHKAEVLKVYEKVSKIPPDVGSRVYDVVMPTFTTDGHFIDSQLEALAKSYVEIGEVKTEPDMHELVTEKFLPKTETN